MTRMTTDDFLKQLEGVGTVDPISPFESPLKKAGPDFSGNVLQDFQQAGGYALAKTLAGISTPG